jgi:hypothetical protein
VLNARTYFPAKEAFRGELPYDRGSLEGAMEKSKPATGSVTIAFLVLVGAVLAFVIGQRVGNTLDHQGRSITVAHDHAPQNPPSPPVAQK